MSVLIPAWLRPPSPIRSERGLAAAAGRVKLFNFKRVNVSPAAGASCRPEVFEFIHAVLKACARSIHVYLKLGTFGSGIGSFHDS